jgi:hypothetical protein
MIEETNNKTPIKHTRVAELTTLMVIKTIECRTWRKQVTSG